jgi:hypothetical protein
MMFDIIYSLFSLAIKGYHRASFIAWIDVEIEMKNQALTHEAVQSVWSNYWNAE